MEGRGGKMWGRNREVCWDVGEMWISMWEVWRLFEVGESVLGC